MGRVELAAARSSLRLVILHLLKALCQPERAARSWRVTIVRERIGLDECLDDNPGLRPRLTALFDKAHADARRLALAETGLPPDRIPEQPPFTLAEVRCEGFMPPVLTPSPGPDDPPG